MIHPKGIEMEEMIVNKGTEGQPGAGAGETGQPAPGTESAGRTAGTPSFNDDTEIELEGGEKITLKELKAGNLRQSDYTHKTMELAKTKKEYEQYAQMATWLNDPANSENAQKIIAILEGKEPVVSETDEYVDPTSKDVAALKAEIKTIRQEEKQRSFASATNDIEGEIAQAKEKYKLADDSEELDDILSIAYGNSKENVVKIADKYFARLEKRDKAKLKEYLEGKTGDSKKVPLSGGGIPSDGGEKKLSLDDGSAKRSLTESLIAGLKAAND